MQPNALNLPVAGLDVKANDLGPLARVLDELRQSLEGAAKALKSFVRDAEASRGSDLAAQDASQLRMARQQLHQAVGAVEVLGLAGPARVLRAMESAVQKFVQQPEQCNQDAVAKIERASFALTEYLEGVLAEKPISAVSLFPQYRDVQELVRADRIHPADLWPYAWRWLEPELTLTLEPRYYDADARATIDQLVLQLMKGKAPQAAESLQALSLGLAAGHTATQPKIFWKIAAAFFQALAHDLLPSDMYVRRAASRVLLQYVSLSKGDVEVSERLTQDLLFFCSQALGAVVEVPVLTAVRSAYGLTHFKPVDYETVQFGRFDPALLAQARKRIVSAKETWSSLAAGDTHKFQIELDHFDMIDAVDDEQIKVIGDLRIGIPLYNVYLNEADEWSRRLVTEVSEWAIERHHPIGGSTVSFAHSLADSSATVGFASLSEIARALEDALQRSQVRYSEEAAAQYANLFVNAAEDIRRLLHQFAAGFLQKSNAGVLSQLREFDFSDALFAPPADRGAESAESGSDSN